MGSTLAKMWQRTRSRGWWTQRPDGMVVNVTYVNVNSVDHWLLALNGEPTMLFPFGDDGLKRAKEAGTDLSALSAYLATASWIIPTSLQTGTVRYKEGANG